MNPQDPTTPAPPRRRRRRRLARLAHVKAGLADVIGRTEDELLRLAEAGAFDGRIARTLIYGYATLAGIVASSELEARIDALERTIASQGARPGAAGVQ